MKRAVFPSDISLTTVSNLKMWLQSFSELLFSLQQSSKNLVSFDFSPPWQENDTFGAKALKCGLLGEGGRAIAFEPANSCRCKKCAHEKGGLVEALLKCALLSSINLFALPFVSCVRPSHALMHIPVSNVASRRNLHVCCEVFRNYIISEACEFVLRWLKKCKPKDYSNIIRLLPVRAKRLFLG